MKRLRTIALVLAAIYLMLGVKTWFEIKVAELMQADLPVELTRRVEAEEWLKTNPNPSALATNRFGTTSEGLAFVQELYRLGAVEVSVTNIRDEEWRIQEEGGAYADSLVLRLPKNPWHRVRLFFVAGRETLREGSLPSVDVGQSSLTLWWD